MNFVFKFFTIFLFDIFIWEYLYLIQLFGTFNLESNYYFCKINFLVFKCIFFKQWPLAGEFVEFEYSPKICHFFVTRSGEFGEYWANFCDSLRRIWRVLSQFGEFGEFGKFGEFGEFGEFGKFGEGRLDRFIHKNIFFCI